MKVGVKRTRSESDITILQTSTHEPKIQRTDDAVDAATTQQIALATSHVAELKKKVCIKYLDLTTCILIAVL